jgi:hypothetical protein
MFFLGKFSDIEFFFLLDNRAQVRRTCNCTHARVRFYIIVSCICIRTYICKAICTHDVHK